MNLQKLVTDIEKLGLTKVSLRLDEAKDLISFLEEMIDRYHEASNEADILQDKINHWGAYNLDTKEWENEDEVP